MILTAGIVLIFTVSGGFLAVALTDLLQAIFMLFALIVLPAVAISQFGGLNLVMETLAQLSPANVDPLAITVGGLIGFLGIGLGSPGNPHILVRYMSIDDPSKLRKSAIIGTVSNVIMSRGAIFIGLVGRALYSEQTQIPGSDPENIYPSLAQTFLHPILFGFVIASIFAAIIIVSLLTKPKQKL